MTLGVGEPFATTFKVAFYFSLLLAHADHPLAAATRSSYRRSTPTERKVAVPLLLMIPVLFLAGVAFGYFLVLPAAVRFLQNFNSDQFNILFQARDYYRFAVITLLASGSSSRCPWAILALARMGVVTRQSAARTAATRS